MISINHYRELEARVLHLERLLGVRAPMSETFHSQPLNPFAVVAPPLVSAFGVQLAAPTLLPPPTIVSSPLVSAFGVQIPLFSNSAFDTQAQQRSQLVSGANPFARPPPPLLSAFATQYEPSFHTNGAHSRSPY